MSKESIPQDIVAVFHASFHPTQGNVIDWSVKASDDLSLKNLEFNALPSGLHLVDEDVVYFNRDDHHGVCIFRRRKTTEHGHRGFRLSSMGILLAKSHRPRPWRHTAALKALVTYIYSNLELTGILEPTEDDWEPARRFFEERKVRRADLGGAGRWDGWSHDLYELETNSNPALHLTHLLRILGPSALTLYKHVLGRRRILILTLPPVEAACVLCRVAADLCFEEQVEYTSPQGGSLREDIPKRLKGKSREGISVLGMITLNDLDRLAEESKTGRGWIACTTDTIYLDKPSCYDLLIDLTTLSPNNSTRPAFKVSKPISGPTTSRGPTHRLSTVRFAWSDVRLWNEVDRLLQLDLENGDAHTCCVPPGGPQGNNDVKSKLVTTWTDAWRVYEDVCIICAGLWMGSWRNNSASSYSTANGSNNWGSVRLDGDDDLTLGNYVRNVGNGIEGGPSAGGSGIGNGVNVDGSGGIGYTAQPRRSSAMSTKSLTNSNLSPPNSPRSIKRGKGRRQASSSSVNASAEASCEYKDGQMLTTLALLQTFHAHTCFQLSQLEALVIRNPSVDESILYLSPKDVLSFELGPWSSLDGRYLEWLAEEYAPGMTVIMKRGWKDMLGVIFGYVSTHIHQE
ncbi:hypothetical protein ONZ45_g7114 [Pleurotus djamor]|nr:hypothetical protein ONZ45_g7114 [Pleurotus djamor]